MKLLTYVLNGLLLYAQRCYLQQQQQNRVLAHAIERQKNTTKVVLRLLIIYAVYNTVPLVIFTFSSFGVSFPHNIAPISILFLETDSMSSLFVFIRQHEEFRKHVKIFLGIKNDTGPSLSSALLPNNENVETAI
jgi:hypothetical protein